jgi:hypothetical protein
MVTVIICAHISRLFGNIGDWMFNCALEKNYDEYICVIVDRKQISNVFTIDYLNENIMLFDIFDISKCDPHQLNDDDY